MTETVVVGSVMTPSPQSIQQERPVAEAKKRMSGLGVRHMPVMDGDEVVSIITDRDINLAVAANKDLRAAESMLVEDVCAMETYMVDAETPLEEVVTFMAMRHIGSALITREGRLAGIFTATDACRLLGISIRGEPLAGTSS